MVVARNCVCALSRDEQNRLKDLTTTRLGSQVQSYAFTLYPAGNRHTIAEAGGTLRTYGYDDLYRLTSETVTGGPHQYAKVFTYDDVGNRETQTTTGGPTPPPGAISYGYDDRDRLMTETGVTGGYEYDTNGNLTDKADGATDYAWDRDNRMTNVTLPDGTTVSHAYDADGNRVQTTTTPPGGPAAVTHYLVDTSGSLSHVVAETDAAGALTAYYVRGDDLLAVMRPTGPTTWATKYVHADGIGSIRKLTDENGAVSDAYEYTAFGERLSSGTDLQPYAFAGEPLDPNIGLQYHRARWMDPLSGRILAMDLFLGSERSPVTLHRYLYASDDPANRVDPTGLFETLATLSVGLGMLNTINGIAASPSALVHRGLKTDRFSLRLRSFAPWKIFGPGFGGDDRSFSTDAHGPSRIWTAVSFRRPGLQGLRADSFSDPSSWGPYTDIGKPTNSCWSPDDRTIRLDVAGANPLLPLFDIDVHMTVSVDSIGPQTCFSGSLEGDAFPNSELYVIDGNGRSTMLHTFETLGDQALGALLLLPGDKRRPMGTFQKCIQ